MIPFAFVTFLLIGLGVFTLSKILVDFRPGEKKVQADLKKMRTEIEPWVGDLIPLEKADLEVFSLNQIKQAKRTRIVTTAKGLFTTIYDEPLVAYSFKRYVSSKMDAILYARSADHEMAYRIKNKEIKVVLDNEFIGTLKENGALYGKGKRMIAKINRNNGSLLPVIVQDREVASIVKSSATGKEKKLSKRALQFVKEDLTKEEEKLLLSIATLELVLQSVGE